MNKEKVRYLADLAAVRENISAILNSGKGVSKKDLHLLSGKVSKFDEEFVSVLKEVLLEEESGGSLVNDADLIKEALQKAKESIVVKPSVKKLSKDGSVVEKKPLADIAELAEEV
jgi:hypothetical protein